MAKKSRFGADTVLDKHLKQSALIAHSGSEYFIPKRQFFDESLSPRFNVVNVQEIYTKQLEILNEVDDAELTIKATASTKKARLNLDSYDADTEIYFKEDGTLKQAIAYSPSLNKLGFWVQARASGAGDWAWRIRDNDYWLENVYNATDTIRPGIYLWGGASYYARIQAISEQALRLTAPNNTVASFIDIKPQGTSDYGLVVHQYDNDSYYANLVVRSDDELYVGVTTVTAGDMVKIYNSATDKGLVEIPSTLRIVGNDSCANVFIAGSSASPRIISSATGLELRGGNSSLVFAVQDGSGRVVFKWNATIGTSETYLESSEPALKMVFTNNDPFIYFRGAGTGTQGNPITWADMLQLYYNSGTPYLRVGYDLDSLSYIGRTAIGGNSIYSDFAYFSHLDMIAAGQYALLQDGVGDTFLNAASGKLLYFRINNADRMIINGTQAYHVAEVYKLNQTTNPLNAFVNVTPVDVKSSMTFDGTWRTFDCTTQTSSNAKWVLISVRVHIINDGHSAYVQFNKQGVSTGFVNLTIVGGMGGNEAAGLSLVPLDSTQQFYYKGDITAYGVIDNVYIVGYAE